MESTGYNCTLVGNSAGYMGGGSFASALYNCVVYYNSPDNDTGSTLNYCCITPSPEGSGNITNEPAFVNQAGADYHPRIDSPCINAGSNAYVFETDDLDGNPRIAGGTVDIGAYEYQHFPIVQEQPMSQNSYFGWDVSLSVDAVGAPPLSYQWIFNGTNISGATNASLVLTNVRYRPGG